MQANKHFTNDFILIYLFYDKRVAMSVHSVTKVTRSRPDTKQKTKQQITTDVESAKRAVFRNVQADFAVA
jgi:chemotaxis signal transduction protein